jgi:selenocysteine lyase/cysteine desulfurase
MIPQSGSDLRALFGLPDDVAYLNCAALAPTMVPACEAGVRGMMARARPWSFSPAALAAEVVRTRALFARLIGATPEDIAIVPSTSYGIAVAARNLPLGQGQRVVMPAGQHYSNVFPWLARSRECGASVVAVPAPGAESWTPALLEAIDGLTAVVAVPNCDWLDGRMVDLDAIARRCRQVGAALVIDATQSLGVLPLDVRRIRPDFVACSAFKWLLGPSNIGLLYAAPAHHEGDPLEHHVLNRTHFLAQRSQPGLAVSEEFVPGASRFDMGQRDHHVLIPMLATALSTLEGWGIAEVAGRIETLTTHAVAELELMGLSALDRQRRSPHILGFQMAPDLSATLAARLAAQGVHVTVRNGFMRVSPHIYNDKRDIGRLTTALEPLLAEVTK